MSAEPPDQKKRESAYDLSGFRVLIIDDSKFIAELQASSLIEMGVGHVMNSKDGAAAKDKIIDHNAAQSGLNIDVVDEHGALVIAVETLTMRPVDPAQLEVARGDQASSL